MASTEEIISDAEKLGALIADHASVLKLQEISQRLSEDIEAQRAMADLNRHMESLQEKQQSGQPIEVADKHKLESLQKVVSKSKVLRDLQMAQMDYLDLMRRVDEALTGEAPASSEGAPGGLVG